MLKRPGTVKATSLFGAVPAAITPLHIVYRAAEQDTVAMVQGLVFDMTAATEPFHQVQSCIA